MGEKCGCFGKKVVVKNGYSGKREVVVVEKMDAVLEVFFVVKSGCFGQMCSLW